VWRRTLYFTAAHLQRRILATYLRRPAGGHKIYGPSADDLRPSNAGNDRWNILASPKNIKWSATFPIRFVGPGDAGYSACAAAANTPALQESLSEEEGCYVQNGTVLYPNAIGTFGNRAATFSVVPTSSMGTSQSSSSGS
jgi:hypothetical protein